MYISLLLTGALSAAAASCDELQFLQVVQDTAVRADWCTNSTPSVVKILNGLDSILTWSFEEDVEEALEEVSGELTAEYQKIVDDAKALDTNETWQDRLKSVGKSILGAGLKFVEIPKAGQAIASLVQSIWPSEVDVYDIFALILGEVKDLIDVQIMFFELQERLGDLLALKRDLKRYARASGTDRGNTLSISLAKAEDIMAHLTSSTNKLQLLPLAIATATIHIEILRERTLHGTEVFGSEDASRGMELQASVAFYQTYFNNAYPSWRTWRAGKVEVDQQEYSGSNHECDIKVTDLLTNIAYTRKLIGGYMDQLHCESVANDLKVRVSRDAFAKMAVNMRLVMYLQRYIPGLENAELQVLPNTRYVTVGPFTAYTQVDTENHYVFSNPWDDYNVDAKCDAGPKELKKMTVWAYNAVDGVEFQYEDGGSCTSHHGGGGTEYIIDLSNKYVTGVNLSFIVSDNNWGSGEVVIMSVGLSDHTSSSYGNPPPNIDHGPARKAYVSNDGTWKLDGGKLGWCGRNNYLCYFEPTYENLAWTEPSSVVIGNGDHLLSEQRLFAGQALRSPNGMYKLVLQDDGNLVIYDIYSRSRWATGTDGQCPDRSSGPLFLLLQVDGQLELWCNGKIIWIGAKADSGGSWQVCRVAAIQNNGLFVVYQIVGQEGVWSSHGSEADLIGFGPTNLTTELGVGQRLVQSLSGAYDLLLNKSGHLLLRDWQNEKKPLWSAGGCNASSTDISLKMQENGNLVLYCSGKRVWASNTADPTLEDEPGVNMLVLQPAGNLQIISKRSATIWQTNTSQPHPYFG